MRVEDDYSNIDLLKEVRDLEARVFSEGLAKKAEKRRNHVKMGLKSATNQLLRLSQLFQQTS